MAFGGPHSSCVRPGAHSARHQGLPLHVVCLCWRRWLFDKRATIDA